MFVSFEFCCREICVYEINCGRQFIIKSIRGNKWDLLRTRFVGFVNHPPVWYTYFFNCLICVVRRMATILFTDKQLQALENCSNLYNGSIKKCK